MAASQSRRRWLAGLHSMPSMTANGSRYAALQRGRSSLSQFDPLTGRWSQDAALQVDLSVPALRTCDPMAVRAAARQRAAVWCDAEAARWSIGGASMLAHAARRCGSWGWGHVRLLTVDTQCGTAELEVALPSRCDALSRRVLVGVLEGWFAGTMEWIAAKEGQAHATRARLQPVAGGRCVLLLR